MTATNYSIPEQRDAAEGRLARLRAERADAVLAGRFYNSLPISDLEQTLTSLAEAEEEAERRQAEARRVAAVEARRDRRAHLVELEDQRLIAVASFGEAAQALAAAIADVRRTTAAVDGLAAKLQPDRGPMMPEALGPQSEMRLSENLSNELRRIIGGAPRFGVIALSPPSHGTAPDDWVAGEKYHGDRLLEVCGVRRKSE